MSIGLWWTLRKLRASNWMEQMKTVTELSKYRDNPRVLELLIAILEGRWVDAGMDSTDVGVRYRAAESIAKIGGSRALEALIRNLPGGFVVHVVGRDTIDVLGEYYPTWLKSEEARAAIPALVGGLRAPRFEGRRRAASALKQLGWMPTSDDERALLAIGLRQTDELLALGSVAVEPLLDVMDMHTKEFEVYDLLAKILTASRYSAPVPRLLAMFQHPKYEGDVGRAADLLACIGDRSAVQPLLSEVVFGRKDGGDLTKGDARKGAIRALGKIGDKSALQPLISLLRENLKYGVGGFVYSIVTALGRMRDPQAVDTLTPLLTHQDSLVRTYAAEALGEIEDPRAVGPLLEMLKTNYDYRERHQYRYENRLASIKALGTIGSELATEALLSAADDTDVETRRFARQAVDAIGKKR